MCVHACVYVHTCVYMHCCNLCVEVKGQTRGVSSLLPAYLGPRSHWVPRLIVKAFVTRAVLVALSWGFLIANLHNYVNQFTLVPPSFLKRTLTLTQQMEKQIKGKCVYFAIFVWRQLLVSCVASTKSVSSSFRFF